MTARLLDQVDDLGQHGIRVAPLAERVQTGHDRRSPLLGVGLDVRGAQCVRDTRPRPDLDRLGEEPVAVRALADDPRRVEHREPPAHGTRKAKALVVPAHRLREPEGADELLHLRGEHLGQRLARDRDPEETVALLELVRRDAVALREPGRGLVPHRHRRAFHPLVGRLRRDVVREHGQTARRDQDPGRLHAQDAAGELGQLALCLPAGGRGQLLAADLNQERRHRLQRRAERSCARACGRGRCRRPVRSRTAHRVRRAG